MAKFPDDAVDFAKDLERLGIRYQSVEAIAGTIGYSTSHVSNLLGGGKPYAPGARTKIGEMIANGAAEGLILPAHPQVKVDFPAETRPRSASMSGSIDKYTVIPVSDGYAVAQNFVAVFRGRSWAEEYADWLNGQIRRGKEAG